jgi:endoglucanase Acf2
MLRSVPWITSDERNSLMKLVAIFLAAGFVLTLVAAARAAEEQGGIVKVGAGSYTTVKPDKAKDPLPREPFKTANLTCPLPQSQWWISLLCLPYSQPLYGHPLAIQYLENGLMVYYPGPNVYGADNAIWGLMFPKEQPQTFDFVLGHSGVEKFPDARCDSFSDWFVTGVMASEGKSMKVTFGHGSPFIYTSYEGGDPTINFPDPPTVFAGSAKDNVLGVSIRKSHYGFFAPAGATWAGLDSKTFTCKLGGKSYFIIGVLPDNKPETLAYFKKYAYTLVTDTTVSWKFQDPGVMKTTFTYATKPLEGDEKDTLFAMYPHQWKYADLKSMKMADFSYKSVRGEMKVAAGRSFETVAPVQGVLPVLPDRGIAGVAEKSKIEGMLAGLTRQTYPGPHDTYAEGKLLGKLANLSTVAEAAGDKDSQQKFLAELKRRLTGWFTATPGKQEQVFWYDSNWSSMIGIRGSFWSDEHLNDHHFHYGYFLRAAGELARCDPEWAKQYGGMVELVIRDIASPSRQDKMFAPFRSFDRYAGHSWASGDGNAIDGCNQESSSEAMNAWYGIILWGMATGDDATRDLGLYLYNTERLALEEYWWDAYGTNFPKDYPHMAVGMVWGGKGAHGTWFSGDPDWVHGISWMPYTPGSVYLGRTPDYAKRCFEKMLVTRNARGNLNEGVGDLLLMFHATEDPADAVKRVEANPQTKFEAGNCAPFFYHWLGTFAALGVIDPTVTCNWPSSNVYKKDGRKTYVVYNFSDKPLTAKFSDGTTVEAKTKGLTYVTK